MKRQNSCGPHWGRLVHQLPRFVTFAYDLRFKNVIAHWKFLLENYTFFHKNLTMSIFSLWKSKKTLFRPPKRSWKYKKMYLHEKFQNKLVGIGGWPPLST
jgi:hypothetical protein